MKNETLLQWFSIKIILTGPRKTLLITTTFNSVDDYVRERERDEMYSIKWRQKWNLLRNRKLKKTYNIKFMFKFLSFFVIFSFSIFRLLFFYFSIILTGKKFKLLVHVFFLHCLALATLSLTRSLANSRLWYINLMKETHAKVYIFAMEQFSK